MSFKKTFTIATLLTLLCTAASAQVGSYAQLRTASWSLYGMGGASTATGDKLFGNVSPSPDTFASPLAGAGVTFNLRPWIRFDLGYEASKYMREQRFASIQSDGLAYRSLDVLYNAVDLTIDFNLAQIFRQKGTSGRFNAYLGSGIGEMFIYGTDYTVKMGQSETVSNDPMNDNYSFKAWLKAHNDGIEHMSPYIPVSLSFEYDVTPRFTLGLRGAMKYLLNDDALSIPDMTESAAVVLRVNFVGHKHGYTSMAKQIESLQKELSAARK